MDSVWLLHAIVDTERVLWFLFYCLKSKYMFGRYSYSIPIRSMIIVVIL